MNPIFKGLLLGLTTAVASRGLAATSITVDENGHGTSVAGGTTNQLTWTLEADPTLGLQGWNVLVYTLPFAGVQGDVLITEPARGNPVGDVLRFDGVEDLIFYSESVTGFDNLADTPGPPNPFYANIAGPFPEQSPLGFPPDLLAWVDYTPGPGQPGYDATALPTYRFYSDVPEPGSGLLLLGGVGALALSGLRQRRSPHAAAGGHQ